MDGSMAMRSLSISISITSIIGNALVCHIIIRVKSMKTSMNYIILNLAILDAISGLLVIFYVVVNDTEGAFGRPVLQRAYNQSTIAPEILCKLQTCTWTGSGISPLLLSLMAYERFNAIVHPLTSLNNSIKSRIRWQLPLCWACGFVFLSIDVTVATFDAELQVCAIRSIEWYHPGVYLIVFGIILYLIPSILMFVLYFRVIWALSLQDQTALGTQGQSQISRNKSRKKVVIIIIAVTIVFYTLCAIPNIINGFLSSNYDNVVILLGSFNAAFNPIVYFIFLKSFQTGFKKAFMNGKKRNGHGSSEESIMNHSKRLSVKTSNVHNAQPNLVSLRVLNPNE